VHTGPGEPPRLRPPLTKRLTRRHWILLDRITAVPTAMIMVALVWADRNTGIGSPTGAWLLLALLLAAAAGFPIALRRVRPLASLATLLALSLTLAALGSQDGLVVALPACHVLYMVATLYPRRVAAIALAATLGIVTGSAFLISRAGNGGTAPGIFLDLVLIIFWGFGSAVRQRRLYAGGLQQQATSRAVAEERLRIARELHDVVAHSMSVIAVQAGFGQYVIDEQPGKAREALGAIQATSRDALDEMRRMLSVLRQADTADDRAAAPLGGQAGRLTLSDLTADAPRKPSGAGDAPGVTVDAGTAAGGQRPSAAPLRPAPGLGDLDRLITRIGHAGVHVDLRVHGERGNVPAGIDLSAFRIVQEALTNVVKHAGTPDCRVTIHYREDELSLEVVDDGGAAVLTPAGAGPGDIPSGHGLIGMRERVHLCGGQFSAGPRPERGFRVAATLPLDRGTA
jgi:signal transduction histidine kinase